MSVNFLAELKQAAFAVRQAHLDRLRSLGISVAWLADCPVFPFGIADCEPSGAGLYQPNPGAGAPHLILPVLENGALVDLVAFRSAYPDSWLLRTGNGFALGLEQGMEPWMWYAPADLSAKPPKHQVGKPTHIFSNPLDWLQGQGDGLCVLDWGSPEFYRLDALRAVTVTDNETAKLLTDALARPARLPAIALKELSYDLAA
jgi:hypothetical protein